MNERYILSGFPALVMDDAERCQRLCEHLSSHHDIIVEGKPNPEVVEPISALHRNLHRFNGSLRRAVEAVQALQEEQ